MSAFRKSVSILAAATAVATAGPVCAGGPPGKVLLAATMTDQIQSSPDGAFVGSPSDLQNLGRTLANVRLQIYENSYFTITGSQIAPITGLWRSVQADTGTTVLLWAKNHRPNLAGKNEDLEFNGMVVIPSDGSQAGMAYALQVNAPNTDPSDKEITPAPGSVSLWIVQGLATGSGGKK